MSEENPTFLELLDWHDEFVFIYNGIKYEIVNGDEYGIGAGISLYLSDDKYGTFIRSFADKDDFLKNAKIEGKSIVEILNKITV